MNDYRDAVHHFPIVLAGQTFELVTLSLGVTAFPSDGSTSAAIWGLRMVRCIAPGVKGAVG